MRGLVRDLRLNTVCEEARCPNRGHCWERGTATFMILGEVCTRGCGFCAVRAGRPTVPDAAEPGRVAEAVLRLGLRHAVVTSVTRDDLPDGGAASFVAVVREIRARVSGCTVEVLIPDFQGDWIALGQVLAARPDILNHNLETVPRLYPRVRPGASFARSVELLGRSHAARIATKSGIMLGLGEEPAEIDDTIREIRDTGTSILTLGQYLRPSPRHLPVVRHYTPEDFERLGGFARGLGFAHVESAPLVRSSYHAAEQASRRAASP